MPALGPGLQIAGATQRILFVDGERLVVCDLRGGVGCELRLPAAPAGVDIGFIDDGAATPGGVGPELAARAVPPEPANPRRIPRRRFCRSRPAVLDRLLGPPRGAPCLRRATARGAAPARPPRHRWTVRLGPGGGGAAA